MSSDKSGGVIKEFQAYLNTFSEKCPYQGPSIYFHERTISLRRSAPLDVLLLSDSFIEYLYAMLVSWGMHRMDGGARMKSFPKFQTAVQGLGSILLSLQNTTLSEFTDDDSNLLSTAMDNHTVMDSSMRLVGNSKVFHHLLPDLVPPIDSNVLKFFDELNGSEIDQFESVMIKIKQMHDRIDWATINYTGPMNTSRPKLIDNAILGYMLHEKEKNDEIEKKEEDERKRSRKEGKKEEKKREQEEFKEWRRDQKRQNMK